MSVGVSKNYSALTPSSGRWKLTKKVLKITLSMSAKPLKHTQLPSILKCAVAETFCEFQNVLNVLEGKKCQKL